MNDQTLDRLLAAAAEPSFPSVLPAPAEELRSLVAGQKPTQTRRPFLRYAVLASVSIGWAFGFAMLNGWRRDLAELPRLWFAIYLGAWAVGFAVLAALVHIPRRREVMPRSVLSFRVAAAVAVGFAAAGLLFARHVPGLSTMYEATFANFARYAPYCLRMGLLTAAGPLVAAALLTRGVLWSGTRMAGFAIGAASGSLGGLMLQLHCPVAEASHLGLVHAGVVVLAAAAGTILVPLLSRVR